MPSSSFFEIVAAKIYLGERLAGLYRGINYLLTLIGDGTVEEPGMEQPLYYRDIAYQFGGAFLANAVPHFVNGMMGRPFQSPFAKPPGNGLSSSTVNVLWGFANFVIAYLL